MDLLKFIVKMKLLKFIIIFLDKGKGKCRVFLRFSKRDAAEIHNLYTGHIIIYTLVYVR